MSSGELDEFKQVLARRLELDPAALFGRSMRLADVIARSPSAKNSIDLMEAVVGALAELELDDRIELPTMTLDNTVDDIVEEFRRQMGTPAHPQA
jgi:hypothetical protein